MVMAVLLAAGAAAGADAAGAGAAAGADATSDFTLGASASRLVEGRARLASVTYIRVVRQS